MAQDLDARTLSFEAEVAPRWDEPFAKLLLQVAPIDPTAMVLDVLCGTGTASLPLLDKLEARGRVVALDPSTGRLAIARRKAGAAVGKRLFFRHEKPERFSFADDVFDVVISNVGVLQAPGAPILAECVRVAKSAGHLAMTLALRGTFQEAHELMREVLERREDEAALRRLDEAIFSYPTDEEAISHFETMGLRDVTLSRSRFTVEFPSGRAFVTSELAAHLLSELWTRVASHDAGLVVAELGRFIDTYFGESPFELTVEAACLVGRKEVFELQSAVALAPDLSGASAVPRVDAPGSTPVPKVPTVPIADDDEATPVRAIAIPAEASAVALSPLASASPTEPMPPLPPSPASTAPPTPRLPPPPPVVASPPSLTAALESALGARSAEPVQPGAPTLTAAEQPLRGGGAPRVDAHASASAGPRSEDSERALAPPASGEAPGPPPRPRPGPPPPPPALPEDAEASALSQPGTASETGPTPTRDPAGRKKRRK